MAEISPSFSFDIAIENETLALNVATVNFSISESIHSMYPLIKLSFQDSNGFLREHLLFIENNALSVTMRDKERDIVKCVDGVIIEDELLEQAQTGIHGGTVKILGAHKFYRVQELGSQSYRSTVSAMVRRVLGNFPFKSFAIEDTLGRFNLHQTLQSQSGFILDTLLWHAHSSSSGPTPFFAWIDLEGGFHFQSYQTLAFKPSTIVLESRPAAVNSLAAAPDQILQYVHVTQGSRVQKKFRNVKVFSRAMADGLIREERVRNDEVPVTRDLKTLVNKQGIADIATSYYSEGWERDTAAIAFRARYFKDSFFAERFKITTHLRLDLVAGGTVALKLLTYTTPDTLGESVLHSGEYLIEDVVHCWNGATERALTEIVVSRKFFPVPSSYAMYSKL